MYLDLFLGIYCCNFNTIHYYTLQYTYFNRLFQEIIENI
jgi:hypothetical protein